MVELKKLVCQESPEQAPMELGYKLEIKPGFSPYMD